jgi:nucleoid DNA-binding protein
MNNKDFLAKLSERTGYSTDDTQKLVQSAIKVLGKKLEDGNTVQINSFGIFEVKKRLERVITNPGTGQKMLVPPKLVLNFKPTVSIKEQLKNGGENNG